MNNAGAILQIVPRAPGSRDGVGDYALTLAACLSKDYGRKTTFAAAVHSLSTKIGDFEVLSPLNAISESQCRSRQCEQIILHYVNYGYERRGVPLSLFPTLRRLRRFCSGSLVTIFHELYASGRPWQSVFWLRPVQIQITRGISQLSNVCIVSNPAMRDQLLRLTPDAQISVHPVMSNFGEPDLSTHQFAARDSHRWVICGGTHLVARSLQSFLERAPSIPEPFSPRELFIVGGDDSRAVREAMGKLAKIKCQYSPEVDAPAASEILSSCSFGWIDYFHRPDVPTGAVLKSTTFAAYCAHGVIPVFPHSGSEISVEKDALPGPYYIAENSVLPAASERALINQKIYSWYQRRASSEHLARGIAAALGVTHRSDAPA